MPSLLLTGFEPFGDCETNPSWTVAERLHGLAVGNLVVVSRRLPVDGTRAPAALTGLIGELEPAAAVMLGLAAGRFQVAVERVAVNVLDYRIADNTGVTHTDIPVVATGPDAYLTSLPARAIVSAWREAGLPGCLSDSAGTFLCNQVFYTARHALVQAGRGTVPAGFIHLPCDEALAHGKPRPYVPLEHQVQAVRVALAVVAASLG